MYPQRELTHLAAHKAALRRDIVLCRAKCARAAARLVQPVAWLDRALALWRRLSPLALLAAVPLDFVAKRAASPRLSILTSLVKWSPVVFGALRSYLGFRSTGKPV